MQTEQGAEVMGRWELDCVFPGPEIEGQGGAGAGRISRPGRGEEEG